MGFEPGTEKNSVCCSFQASLNRAKGLSNAQNFLHFLSLVRKISRKELNEYNAGGMTFLQKGNTFELMAQCVWRLNDKYRRRQIKVAVQGCRLAANFKPLKLMKWQKKHYCLIGIFKFSSFSNYIKVQINCALLLACVISWQNNTFFAITPAGSALIVFRSSPCWISSS